jgi:hypothetical protein
MIRLYSVAIGAVLLGGPLVQAGPLTEAQVTKIINDVRVVDPAKGSHPASVNERIHDEIGLKTGMKSRSELLFQDDTLARLGPETTFSFKAGTRDLSLPEGTMLLQVPKGLGGAKIRTAAVTAALTGTTIMMKHAPNKQVKVLVLEGSLQLSNKADSVTLPAGQMIVMRPNATHIPTPVTVDLRYLMQTSALLKMKGKHNLSSAPLIEKEIQKQGKARNDGTLVKTDLNPGDPGNVTELRGLRKAAEPPTTDSVGFTHHR